MDSNAEIFATHLEQVQWAPPANEGVDDIDTDDVLDHTPLVQEKSLTMNELVVAISKLVKLRARTVFPMNFGNTYLDQA